MFALGIQYLTGYAVATEVADRYRAEWPPHPARVFMALAAAYFETGEDPGEQAALEWLQTLPAPSLQVSEADPREVVTVFVPPNDYELPRNPESLKPEGIRAAMSVLPAYRSNRQPRTFPCVHPRDDTTYLSWPNSPPTTEHLAALERLCAKVVRIGHSSSLVQMWVAGSAEEVHPNLLPDGMGEYRLRVAGDGALDYLRSVYNREEIEAYADFRSRIAAARGKARAALRQEFSERFGRREPSSLRPIISRWQAYRRASPPSEGTLPAVG